MPSRPLHISMYKIKLGSMNSEIQAQMDAGEPGPIEKFHQLCKSMEERRKLVAEIVPCMRYQEDA